MKIFSPRGQVTAVLLHTLATLKSYNSKGYTCTCIKNWGLLAFEKEDFDPYPSVKEKFGTEPRWVTLVAFARSDCVGTDLKWMVARDDNQWKITQAGIDILERLKARCRSGEVDIRNGFLWSAKFKQTISPEYTPSEKDARRPWGSIYDDTKLSAFLDAF